MSPHTCFGFDPPLVPAPVRGSGTSSVPLEIAIERGKDA